jgi:murein DD-endopeptidase MepM/ murein hydrolase activator NlpD
VAVVQGQLVNKGDLVGMVGQTGLAEGPHLHWEIVVRGVEVDALLWTQAEYGPLPPG